MHKLRVGESRRAVFNLGMASHRTVSDGIGGRREVEARRESVEIETEAALLLFASAPLAVNEMHIHPSLCLELGFHSKEMTSIAGDVV